MKKKAPSILVYVTKHMPIGGIESHIKQFCSVLSDSGIEIDLIVFQSKLTPDLETFYRGKCRKVYLNKLEKPLLKILWLFLTGLKTRFRYYDALYTNGQGESIKLVSTFFPNYGCWVHHHHMSGDEKDQRTWGKNYRWVLTNADEVVACSTRNATDMNKLIKRNYTSIPCFSRRIELNDKNHLGEKVNLGYYGRLVKEKGIDLICQLSNEPDLSFIQFHIWGEGESYPPKFFNAFPSLHFHGPFVTTEELKKVFQTLDGFLLLSTHPEGLPICLLESMSVGLPWLATNRGGIVDIAFDPLSTRVIESVENYAAVKNSVKAFANDIKAGIISRQIQKEHYEHSFSSQALQLAWRNLFRIKQDSHA